MFNVEVYNNYGEMINKYTFDAQDTAVECAKFNNQLGYRTAITMELKSTIEKERKVMSTEKIIGEIIEEVKNRGLNIELKEVTKNGIKLTGLFLKHDNTIGCVTYIDEFIKQIKENKITLEKVVEKIIEALNKGCAHKPDVKDFMDLRYVIDNLYIGLQRKTNEELVKRVYSGFEDFEAYLYIRKTIGDSVMSLKASSALLNELGLNQNKAWKIAEENTFEEIKIKSMVETMSELMGVPYNEMHDDKKMYVLTNTDNYKGAAGILDRERLKALAKKLGTRKLIIIPSSIHEVLIAIPDDNLTIKDLEGIIQSVNTEQVDPVEQLGDKPVVINF